MDLRRPFAFLFTGLIVLACGDTVDPVQPSDLTGADAGPAEAGPAPFDAGTPTFDCVVDGDCPLPQTTPASCAEALCDPILRKCSYRAKDADGDGHRTATCALTVNSAVPLGDDCDDADPATFPGAAEVCDGKDHTCGAPTDKCKCVQGTSQSCYTGPTGTKDVAACKGGTQQCNGGTWGPCTGQVLPTLAQTAPGDAAHPCDGTNWWCDPKGYTNHCGCSTKSAPVGCGSASTCNPSATKSCQSNGTYGACSPGVQGVCTVGSTEGCTTCSTFDGFATSGNHTCNASCAYDRCVPTAIGKQWLGANTIFGHNIGSADSPLTPDNSYFTAAANETGYMRFGPYSVLPAGRYRVNWSFYGNSTSRVVLDVVNLPNGTCGGSLGGLCGQTVVPNNNGATTNYTYSFTILADCLDRWEVRVNKLDGNSALKLYDVTLYYDGP